MCASAAAPGRGTEKGGYRGHLIGCPVSVVRRERRISQPQLKTVADTSRMRSRGITYRHLRKVPFPCLAKSCLVESHLAENRCALEQQFSQAFFSSNSFLKEPRRCTLHAIPIFGRCGGVRSCLFLLVLPSIQTVLSAPDFHRFGLSCGRASLAESWRPVRMRRFVRFFRLLARAVRGL